MSNLIQANRDYRRAYLDDSIARFRKKIQPNRDAAQQEWSRFIRHAKMANLSDRSIESKRNELVLECGFEEDEDTIKRMSDERETKLNELALSVKFVGDCMRWWLVKVSSSYDFKSYGWGDHKYAEGILIPYREYLTSVGLIADIRYSHEFYYSRDYMHPEFNYLSPEHNYAPSRYNAVGEYRLWVNCPKWMADAAFRRTDIEFKARLARYPVDLQHYMPHMPYYLVEKIWKMYNT